MSEIIRSFQVSNFRGFENLTVDNLSRVNLITGKNNTGKTCLLEAISLYKSEFESDLLYKILHERNELEDEKLIIKDHSLRYIFNNFKLLNDSNEEKFIHFISNLGNYKIGYYQYVRNEDGSYTPLEKKRDNIDKSLVQDGLFIIKEGQKKLIMNLQQRDRTIGTLSNYLFDPDLSTVQLIFQSGFSQKEAKSLWNLLLEYSKRPEVIQILNTCIDSSITDIDLLEYDGPIAFKVKITGVDRKIPLGTLGGGVTKLFYITLPLVNLNSGCLMIDEIENGLHWTVQEKLWEILFKYAKQKNIQVFATTHSLDCIRAFQSVWEQNPDDGACIRLQHHSKRGLIAVPLHRERLSSALETHVEMR